MPNNSRGSDIIVHSVVKINTSRGFRGNKDYRAVGSYWREACNIAKWYEEMVIDRSYPEEG